MKLLCAPMATLTHAGFRTLVENFGGCDEHYSEMINAGTFVTGGPFERFYVMPGSAPQKMVWQITGRKTEHIARAAEMLARLAGIGIDINMGCSAPEIVKSGAGVAWMAKPLDETRAMVREVRAALKNAAPEKRLSVKLRLGSGQMGDEDFFAFCDMLVEEGVRQIVLHARTSRETYRAKPRWEYCERLALRCKTYGVSVALNGDVKDAASLRAALEAAPSVSGVMVGRGAAVRPWIFAELKSAMRGAALANGDERLAPEINNFFDGEASADAQNLSINNFSRDAALPAPALAVDRENVALDFLDLLEEYQPQEFWRTRRQRFFSYYCSQFSFAHYFQTQMLNAKDNDDARDRIRDYFKRQPSDKFYPRIDTN